MRAYDDLGDKVGSSECEEGQIFIEPQGMCVLADIGLALVLVFLAVLMLWRLFDLFKAGGRWQTEMDSPELDVHRTAQNQEVQ